MKSTSSRDGHCSCHRLDRWFGRILSNRSFVHGAMSLNILWLIVRLLHLVLLRGLHEAEAKLSQNPILQVVNQLIRDIFELEQLFIPTVQCRIQRVLKPLKEAALVIFEDGYLVLQIADIMLKFFLEHGYFALKFPAERVGNGSDVLSIPASQREDHVSVQHKVVSFYTAPASHTTEHHVELLSAALLLFLGLLQA